MAAYSLAQLKADVAAGTIDTVLAAFPDMQGRLIGKRFQDGDIFVPEMLIAARAMKEATTILEPVLVEAGIHPEYTAVIGTVEGDLQDIGKNLVGMMLKGAAIAVVDLGVNVTAERFVEFCEIGPSGTVSDDAGHAAAAEAYTAKTFGLISCALIDAAFHRGPVVSATVTPPEPEVTPIVPTASHALSCTRMRVCEVSTSLITVPP